MMASYLLFVLRSTLDLSAPPTKPCLQTTIVIVIIYKGSTEREEPVRQM